MTMNQEPEWLREYRKKNLAILESKPIKKSQYFDVKKLDGFLVNNNKPVRNIMPAGLKKSGIELLSWNEALAIYPSEIRSILEKEKEAKSQYEAFVNANFNTGFVAVVDKEIDGLIEYNVEADEATIKNIIIIKDNIEGIKILEHLTPGLKFMNETISLGENSKMVFCRAFNLENTALVNQQCLLERDARLINANAYLNGQDVHARVVNILNGEAASVEQFDFSLLNKEQFFNVELLSIHNAENAYSNSILKTVLNDKAKNLFDGMIKIMPSGQKANALLVAHSLLLSEDASANNIPNLEIEADDVKATHSATVTNIDEEQLFYLRSRGLSVEEARHAIIKGFLEGVIFKLPSDYNEKLSSILTKKMWEGELKN